MHAKHVWCGLFTVLAWFLGSVSTIRSAQAQAFYPQAQLAPSHPPLSPYLDLLRDDNSVLSPYHSFVVPRRAVQQQQARQSLAIGQLQATVASYQESRARPLDDFSRLTTGGGGTFQNYSHFYPTRLGAASGGSSNSPARMNRTSSTKVRASNAVSSNLNQRR